MIEINEFKKAYPNYSDFFIGKGKFAQCFKIDDIVYKQYIDYVNKTKYYSFYNNLLFLNGLKYKTIAFPKKLIVDDSKSPNIIYGYLMDYKKSTNANNIYLINMLQAIQNVEKDVLNLANDHKIIIEDIHKDNIIIDEKSISCIDIDFYTKSSKSIDMIRATSFGKLSYGVFESLTDISIYNSCYFKNFNKKLRESTIDGETLFSQFWVEYVKYLEDMNERKIATVSDLRKTLKKC